MWSLVKLVAIGLFIEHLGLQSVVSEGNCRFIDANGADLEIPEMGLKLPTIKDITKPGTILLLVNTTDIKSITNVTSDSILNYRYIDAVLENNQLSLILTDLFVDYEKYEYLSSTSIKVKFECSSGSEEKEFTQPIEDTNNNAPEFEKNSYVYTLPMPFPKNVALNTFTSIFACDIDITNTNITFDLDSNDPNVSGFSVSYLSLDTVNRKCHYATLRTTAVINFAEDVTFSISAEDTGVPPKKSTTNVTIQVDHANSILRFARPLYTTDLTTLKPQDANGKIINFDEGDVSLVGGADKAVDYTIQDHLTGYTSNFDRIIADNRSTLKIRLVDPPEKFFLENFVILSLTATKPGAEETTVLHLSLPGCGSMSGTTEPSEECDCSKDPGASECDSIGYVVAIALLAILLVATTVGLVVTVIKNRRIRGKRVNENLGIGSEEHEERKTHEMIRKIREKRANENLGIGSEEHEGRKTDEMIRNGNVSRNGSLRKSMAFNDTVEQMKISRL